MTIYDSKQWINDLNMVISGNEDLEKLSGKTIYITGCTGLIGSALIDVLIRWNEMNDGKIYIIAAGRNSNRIKKRFGKYTECDWFDYVYYDATVSNNIIPQSDYAICAAGNATPNRIVKEPVETIWGNVNGVKCVLDAMRDGAIRKMLYVSSSEIYGVKNDNEPYKKEEYGFIDILNPRNSYSVGKRAVETLCASYASEYDTDVVIVRPGHIYGPTASQGDIRVSSLWAYEAAKGRDIVMKSKGMQIRSYCHCLDCATAIIKVLISGEKANAYNISNPNSVFSISDLAGMLAKAGGVAVRYEIPEESEKKGFNPMNNSALDSSELVSLGWKGMFDPNMGINDTVKVIREIYGGY